MLQTLRIKNLAVVEDANLSFTEGLNVLTGSTGAGKSLILSAVNILLGERTPVRAIRAGEEKAVVEGEFLLGRQLPVALLFGATDGKRLVLRREIHRSGRSFAFVNGEAQPLKQLHEIVRELIEPHGQNEQLQLRHEDNHIAYLDKLASNTAQRTRYQKALEAYRAAQTRVEDFDRKLEILKEKKELLEHRIDELGRARLEPGEKEALEGRVRLMENAQEIYRALSEACDLIYDNDASAVGAVARARKGIERVADLDERFEKVATALDGVEITLQDGAAEMRTLLESLEFDPATLEEMQDRLGYLAGLERRYQLPISELIRECNRWRDELESLAFEDEERAKLVADQTKCAVAVRKAAMALTASRKTAGATLDQTMTREIGQLMMRGASFRTDISCEVAEAGDILIEGRPVHLFPDGIDRVVFHVRTNPGEAEGSVGEIASSGELSRIALALKTVVSIGREGSVLVFDEVDAGVGADLGDVIAGKLGALAGKYQIICITHMPQIAAHARRHLVVRKRTAGGRTAASVARVEGEERMREISRMLGGDSQKRLALAREMLQTESKRPSKQVRP